MLRATKKAASVTAELELYTAGEELKKAGHYPAEVSGPFPAAGGWEYRITISLPRGTARAGESWGLSATAKGRGARRYASLNVVEKN